MARAGVGGEGQRTWSGLSRAPRLAWPLAHRSASSTRHLGGNDLSGTVPTELALLDKLSILCAPRKLPPRRL